MLLQMLLQDGIKRLLCPTLTSHASCSDTNNPGRASDVPKVTWLATNGEEPLTTFLPQFPKGWHSRCIVWWTMSKSCSHWHSKAGIWPQASHTVSCMISLPKKPCWLGFACLPCSSWRWERALTTEPASRKLPDDLLYSIVLFQSTN